MKEKSVERKRTQASKNPARGSVLSAIIEATPGAMVVADSAGRIITLNAGAIELLGGERSQLVGRPLAELIAESSHADFRHAEKARGWRGKLALKKGDSTELHDAHVLPLNVGGTRFLLAAFSGDGIAAANEERFRASLKEVSDLKAALDEHAIVAITNPAGRITFVNDKFCAISKYSRAELLGQDHRIINSGYHPREFFRNLWQTIASGRVWHGEIRNRAKDGSFYWVDTTIVPFLNEEGKPAQYVAIRADITDRKRATEALRESEETFRTMVDAITQLAWMANPDGYIYWYNQRWFDYTGTTPAEMEGWGWQRVHDPVMLPSVIERWTDSIATGEQFEMDFPLRAANGEYRWFLTRAVPYKDATGKVVRWCGTNTDISRIRDAELEIQRLNGELEKRVIERTAQLEAANKELEAFSYSVSHDLRAPLRTVDGFSQAVLEDFGSSLPDEGQRYLQTIRNGAQQMGRLIDDLLTFSRLSRAPLRKQEVNTESLVFAVLDDLRGSMESREVDVGIGKLPTCPGDPALLKQVWFNLLSNALKYSKNRHPAIIEVGCEAGPQGDVFYVRDNGTGFDMKYAGKLFGVFQRLHRAEEYEGTGVGLALVQRIINRHGGRVWAEAEVDRGATFYFTVDGEPKL